jgi:hypothetical protein
VIHVERADAGLQRLVEVLRADRERDGPGLAAAAQALAVDHDGLAEQQLVGVMLERLGQADALVWAAVDHGHAVLVVNAHWLILYSMSATARRPSLT